MAYIGKSPSTGIRNRFIYTATAGQTSFSGSDDHSRTLSYTDAEFVDVYLNGVKLDKSDYTATSGTSVVLDEGAAVDDILEVIAFDTFSVFSGEFSADVTVGGSLTVDTDTLHVDSTNNRVGVGTVSPLYNLDLVSSSTGVSQSLRSTSTGSTNVALRIQDGTTGTGSADGLYIGRTGSNSTNYIWTYENEPMVFATNNTERWRIEANGNLKAATNGLGIDFSASEGSGATSSVLDDYEEGTFTPRYTGATNPTISYVDQDGTYVKIGRQVICNIVLRTSSLSGGSGSVLVTDLPFTSNSYGAGRAGTAHIGYSSAWSDDFPLAGYVNNGVSYVVLTTMDTSSAQSGVNRNPQVSDMATGSNKNFIMMTVIYTA